MKKNTDAQVTADTHAYAVDDEILLFQSQTRHILRLNPVASVVWKGLSAGIAIAEIVQVLSQSTGSHYDIILSDINGLIEQWRELGIVQNRNRPKVLPDATQINNNDDEPQISLEKGETFLPAPCAYQTMAFKIIETPFILEAPGLEILQLIEPLFSHLSVSDPEKNSIRFTVAHTTLRYLLLKEGIPIDWCHATDGIAPMIHGNALMQAYDEAHCLIGIHAAAVALEGKTIVLPALSGSGKSTLTAALVGSGFRYLADDLILLTPTPVRMRPVPVAMGLKSGAWSLLTNYLPNVDQLATHRRMDGKQVRYFVPEIQMMDLPPVHTHPVHAVLFSKYNAGSLPALTQISPAGALCKIAEAGYDANQGLTPQIVAQLVDWISATSSFELEYSNLEHAVQAVKSVIHR